MKYHMIIIILLLFIFSCSTSPKATPEQTTAYESGMREGEALIEKADYSSLIQAYHLYESLLSIPMDHRRTRLKLLKTCLLLALREKELGITDEDHLQRAASLVEENRIPPEYAVALDIAESFPSKAKGVIKDTVPTEEEFFFLQNLEKKIPLWFENMKRRSGRDLFFTYFFLSLYCQFSDLLDVKIDLDSYWELYSKNPLIGYRLAVCGTPHRESLKNFLDTAPQFSEAYFYLGEISLAEGKLFEAEEYYLKAFRHIPRSTSVIISLANIYFVLEELEKSIDYYDKALSLAPEYRDALLGKAIALSYLERHEEALSVLKKLYDLGKYFLGETHYWQAWNLRELGRLDEARSAIETSKNYLIGHPEVFTLAGKTALAADNPEEAEKNFKEALKIRENDCEALFNLGRAYALQEDWNHAGTFYERASLCYSTSESALKEKMEEVENSGFSQNRKDILLPLHKNRIRLMIEKKASSEYNAAFNYHKAGMPEKALGLAQKASKHPGFKAKAEELLADIKSKH